jgi:hypothetical protein
LSTKTGNTVKAAENPDLVNQMVAQTLASVDTTPEPVAVMPPSDNLVTLPGGYLNPAGEVIKTVEVRELNGKDEEAIARTTSMGKAILTILQRGTVKVGDMPATEELLDGLLAGDRDAIMLGIYKATFGKTADIQGVCLKENKFLDVKIDIDHDIEVRKMEDPYKRKFTLDCKVGPVDVVLPTGYVQKDLVNNTDKTVSELTTILLENCVVSINGKQGATNTALTVSDATNATLKIGFPSSANIGFGGNQGHHLNFGYFSTNIKNKNKTIIRIIIIIN